MTNENTRIDPADEGAKLKGFADQVEAAVGALRALPTDSFDETKSSILVLTTTPGKGGVTQTAHIYGASATIAASVAAFVSKNPNFAPLLLTAVSVGSRLKVK